MEMDDDTTTAVLVSWSRLTGVDAELVVNYNITYKDDDNGRDQFALFPANVGYGRISNLTNGEEYSFQVSAIAVIDGDIIEGDKSVISIATVHQVPPTVLQGMIKHIY